MNCKHCGKSMDNKWYKTTKGYCYTCRISGFSFLKEKVLGVIFRALRKIIVMQ